jgi:hypothetical protein
MSEEKKTATEVEEFLSRVRGMGEAIGLKDDDLTKYTHEHMTRAGYKMVPSYVKEGEETSDTGVSSIFSSKKTGTGGWL